MKFWNIIGGAVLVFANCSIAPANAAVLVGSATLQSRDDLTVVSDGTSVYEFLDLSATSGSSQRNVLSLYGKKGFTVASNVDMARLFSSFGIDYAGKRAASADLGATEEQVDKFISYLGGNSWGVDSVGTFIDSDYGQSVAWVVASGSQSRSYVANIDRSDGWLGFGTFLVRTSSVEAAQVPEPPSIALLGFGLLGFAVRRRNSLPSPPV